MSGKLIRGMREISRTRALVAAILAIAILGVCLCTHLGALELPALTKRVTPGWPGAWPPPEIG